MTKRADIAQNQTAKCRLCRCILGHDPNDSIVMRVCGSCRNRPEARNLGACPAQSNETGQAPARNFTESDHVLIRNLHATISQPRLLALLNDRLHSDLGPDASPYTVEQLEETIGRSDPPAVQLSGNDWAGIRRLLGEARRKGVLATINRQILEDFAVVFSLSPAQLLHLKEVIVPALEGEAKA